MPIGFSKARWQQIQTVLDELQDLASEERAAHLHRYAETDPELIVDVQRLLQFEKDAPTFLDQPALDLVSTLNDLMQGSGTLGMAEDDSTIGENNRIGAYVLRERLGRGGMGVVYRAERDQGDFEQQVAIKFLSNWRSRPTIKERFRREQQLLASLDHPHIARLIDGGLTEEGQPYLVMEFVQGDTILDYCEQHKCTIDARLQLIEQIIEALSYAHSQLIVHRDIKPSNILVTQDGAVKLLDFGVAKLIGDDVDLDLTVTGEQVMTPGFAAPEQLQNQAITVATDVYQLGLVMYELLTGKQAYQHHAKSFAELVNTICHSQPTLPSVVVSNVTGVDAVQQDASFAAQRNTDIHAWKRKLSGDLDAIVLKMLANKPSARYPSMDALSADLQAYFEHRPISAQQQNLSYRVRKALQRHWRPIAIMSAFVVVLVAYAVTMTFQSRRIQAALEASVIEKQKANSVADFMLNIFKAADPNVSGLEQVTAKELLEQGRRRIDSELTAVPAIQGHMLTALGEIYYSQGLAADSRELLIGAVEKQRLAGPGNELGLAASLTQLAIVYSTTNNYSAAEELFTESGELYKQHSSEADLAQNTDYAEHTNAYGLLLLKRGQLAEAEQSIRQSISILQRASDGNDGELAVALNNLAQLQTVMGDLASARKSMQSAIVIHERILGEQHSYFSIYLVNYGNLLTKLERYNDAKPVLLRALKLQTELLGESHPYVASTLRNLGVLSYESGELDLAESYLSKALEIRLANSQHDTLMTATIHLQLGTVLRDAERMQEATRHFSAMRAMHEQLQAGDHIVGLGLCAIARQSYLLGDYQQAKQTYQQAVALLQDSTLRRAVALIGLAETEVALGEQVEAASKAEQALLIREQNLPAEHGQIAEAKAVLGLALAAGQQAARAHSLLNAVSAKVSERPLHHYGGNASLAHRVKQALLNPQSAPEPD